VAFLLPIIESLVRRPPQQARQISALVLAPTRELARQIEEEAARLLTFHPFKVQCVFGGTNINAERGRLMGGRCDILVATPGRLLDHITNNGVDAMLLGLRVLVFDEADRLLDMGFRADVEKIMSFVNRAQGPRQSMLFSATIPKEVRGEGERVCACAVSS
jgi:ATP-dependent RNA helicase MSS116